MIKFLVLLRDQLSVSFSTFTGNFISNSSVIILADKCFFKLKDAAMFCKDPDPKLKSLLTTLSGKYTTNLHNLGI